MLVRWLVRRRARPALRGPPAIVGHHEDRLTE